MKDKLGDVERQQIAVDKLPKSLTMQNKWRNIGNLRADELQWNILPINKLRIVDQFRLDHQR